MWYLELSQGLGSQSVLRIEPLAESDGKVTASKRGVVVRDDRATDHTQDAASAADIEDKVLCKKLPCAAGTCGATAGYLCVVRELFMYGTLAGAPSVCNDSNLDGSIENSETPLRRANILTIALLGSWIRCALCTAPLIQRGCVLVARRPEFNLGSRTQAETVRNFSSFAIGP